MVKKIQVELQVKDKGTAAVKKFSSSTSSALKKLAGPLAAGAVIASFTALVKSTIDYGDKLHKLNLQLGVSVENLDKMKRVGELAGVSLDQITTSIRVMARNLNDAAEGTGLATDALEDLGLNAAELLAMDPDQAFIKIAEALQTVENPTKRAALAMDTMGRSGTVVIQMSKDLQKEIDGTTTSWNQQRAEQAAFINDEMTKTKNALQDLAVNVLPIVVAALKEMADIMDGANKIFEAFFKNIEKGHKDWVTSQADVEGMTKRVRELTELINRGFKVEDEQIIYFDKEELQALQTEYDNLLKKMSDLKKKTDEIRAGAKGDKTTGIEPAEVTAPGLTSDDAKKAEEEWQVKLIELKQDARDRAKEDFEFLENLSEQTLQENIARAEEELEKKKELKELELEMLTEAKAREVELEKKAAEERKALMEQIGQAVVSTVINPLIDAAAGAKDFKEVFRDMAISILKQLAAIAVMKAIAGMAGGGGGTAAIPHIPALAMGGIVKGGFTKFAGGGVVDRPTLGMIGEGGLNEAVVPLPDGRSIPVNMDKESEPTQNTFFISAVDSKSFVELARRNPEAIIRPLTEQIEKGNQGLRQNLRKAVK